jgi:hypothetical protein
MHYNTIYLFRRGLFLAAIVILNKVAIIQILIQLYSTLAFLIYLTTVKPYEISFSNKYEIANELMVVFCLYHLYLFTDFIPKEIVRKQVGLSLFMSICLLMSISVS